MIRGVAQLASLLLAQTFDLFQQIFPVQFIDAAAAERFGLILGPGEIILLIELGHGLAFRSDRDG